MDIFDTITKLFCKSRYLVTIFHVSIWSIFPLRQMFLLGTGTSSVHYKLALISACEMPKYAEPMGPKVGKFLRFYFWMAPC